MIDDHVRRRIFDKIDEKKDEMIGFLRELVRTPSVTGYEKDAQRLVAEKFSGIGLELDIFDADEVKGLKEHPGYFETTAYQQVGYKDRPNVVGKVRGLGGGRSLILNGHIDVVPPDPIEAWKYNPWEGVVENGRVYGRGAMDMKGGIAVMTYVLKGISELGIKLKGDLILETTIEEEAGGVGGVLATILRGYTANAAIFVEPHYSYIEVASAGILYFRVRVPGVTAHAYQAHLGVNAIVKTMKICEALTRLNEERQKRISYPYAENLASHMKRHATTLNIGKIKGGDWPSSVPGWVDLECRVGYPPGEDLRDVMKEIEETVRETAAKDSWLKDHVPKVEWFGWRSRPHEQDVNHPIVKMVKEYAEEVIGQPIKFCGGFAGNDARFFVLYANVPAVLFGPTGKNGHGTDEYVEIDSMIGAGRVLALTVLDWCGFEYNGRT